MNKYIFYFILNLLSLNFVYGQQNPGSRLIAMGRSSAAVKDVWGVEDNPAGIIDQERLNIQLNYQKYAYSDELSSQALAIVMPHHKNAFGINLQRYGLYDFNEIKTGFIVTRKFGPLSIGLRGNLHQLKITGYGNESNVSFDAGMIYHFSRQLNLGFYIDNPSAAKTTNISIPINVHIGIAYQANASFIISGTIQRIEMDFFTVAMGMEYKLANLLFIRTGVTLKPIQHYFGFGLNYNRMMLDFALTNDSNIGQLPQLTLGYAF